LIVKRFVTHTSLVLFAVFSIGAVLLSGCSSQSSRAMVGDDTLLALIDDLKDSDKNTRMRALKALAQRHDPRAIDAISQLLKSESWTEREAAVLALGDMRDHLALQPLFSVVDDSNKFVRDSASKALDQVVVHLGNKADPRMLRVIKKELSAEKSVVREKAADSLKLAIRSLRYVAASEYLKYVLSALEDDETAARVAAAEIMRNIDHPDVYKPMLKALADPKPEVRNAVANSLENLSNPPRREPIIEAIAAGNHFVIENAAKLLSRYRRGDFKNEAIAMLANENPAIREAGVYTLVEWQDSAYIFNVLPLLKDPVATVRMAAAKSLDQMGWTAVNEEDVALQCVALQDWRRCRDVKAELLFAPLLEAVKDEDVDVRGAASDMLLELDWKPTNPEQQAQLCVMKRDWSGCADLGTVAVPALIRELNTTDVDARIAIIEALGRIGDDRAAAALGKLVKDGDQEIRYTAVTNLGLLRSRNAIESLIEGLDDSSNYVRRAALKALTDNMDIIAKVKDIRAVEPVVRAVKDNNSNVRKIAISILGNINNAQVVAPLIDALNDVDAEVRAAATAALDKQKSPTSMEALVDTLSNPKPEVREQALLALAEFKNDRLLKHFNKLLEDPVLEVRVAAVIAIGKVPLPNSAEILENVAKDKDKEVKMQVIKSIVGHDSPAEARTLLKLAQDFDKEVRLAARQQLLEHNWEPQNNLEQVLKCIFQKAWYQCDELGIDAVLPLVAELEFNVIPDRPEIIRALGKIGNIQAVDGILKAMALTEWENHGDDDVVQTLLNANRALTQIGKQATLKLVPSLKDWYMGPLVVDLLNKFEWKPRNDLEKMYFYIAKRQPGPIVENWQYYKKVLQNNLKSKEAALVKYTVYTLISLGQEDSIDILLEFLQQQGNLQYAELYLNCGNQRLERAAKSWAIDQGLSVDDKRSGNSAVAWAKFL